MFQRFTSVLFGDPVEELRGCPAQPVLDEKSEEDEWILVDYLAEACASGCEDSLVAVCAEDVEEEEEAAVPDFPVRYASCSSLDSAADTDPEDGGFLRVDAEACGLEESWFITPPPCFTAGGRVPILLETSPLENLLIEHPSMSVYATHGPRLRPAKEPPHPPAILRTEAQRRPSQPTGCYAAALATRAGFLDSAKHGRLAQRIRDNMERQHLSRNALRRLNLLRAGGPRQPKAPGGFVHQPGQRQFNY